MRRLILPTLALAGVAGALALAPVARAARGLPLPPPVPADGAPGTAEAECRGDEPGPALVIDIAGFKDRKGLIKLEVYPSNDADFLFTDTKLLAAGKAFRRVEERVPASGPVALCARVPGPGPYSVVVVHKRSPGHKFAFTSDGVGFPGNPRLGWGAPKAAEARIVAGPRITRTTVVLNYFRGLGMGPVSHAD